MVGWAFSLMFILVVFRFPALFDVLLPLAALALLTVASWRFGVTCCRITEVKLVPGKYSGDVSDELSLKDAMNRVRALCPEVAIVNEFRRTAQKKFGFNLEESDHWLRWKKSRVSDSQKLKKKIIIKLLKVN